MGSYRTVLVGTDGSDSSMKAVEHAATFAAQQGAKLVIATAHFHEVEKGSWARAAAPEKATHHAGNWRQWAVKGLCISGLNPKVFLLFLALLPQFTDPTGSWSIAMQMSALGVMHLITCTLVYLLVGYGSKAVLATRPQAARLVSRASGGLMVLIAMVLLLEQVR